MKLMPCPINGYRPISEFIYGGVVRPMPDPNSVRDEGWADYVFNRDNGPGMVREWWCHTPSNTWFIAQRHSQTDEILCTYLYGEEEAS